MGKARHWEGEEVRADGGEGPPVGVELDDGVADEVAEVLIPGQELV